MKHESIQSHCNEKQSLTELRVICANRTVSSAGPPSTWPHPD